MTTQAFPIVSHPTDRELDHAFFHDPTGKRRVPFRLKRADRDNRPVGRAFRLWVSLDTFNLPPSGGRKVKGLAERKGRSYRAEAAFGLGSGFDRMLLIGYGS